MNVTTRKPFVMAVCLLVVMNCFAQTKSPCKFGRVTAADFLPKAYPIDSSANAVVLADIGEAEVVGNNKGNFSVHFKRYARIHILNKNGYSAGDVSVALYKDGIMEEDLATVKAVTYNLEDGKVTEYKLEKSNVFKDKTDKNWVTKKFTLPNLKEGSIIEYQYETNSDYIHGLEPWAFQGGYPVLWSEYTASIPKFLSYAFLAQGYRNFDIKDSKERSENFSITDRSVTTSSGRYDFLSSVTDHHWVMKNVPALKEENFTTTLRNHIAKLEFQLTQLNDPFPYRNMMGTWGDLAKLLLEDEKFGQTLDKNNNWLGDIEKPLLAGASSDMEKASRIFAYVRDNFTCIEHNGMELTQPLKAVVKSRNGSEADINLLLTAMLKYANIESSPIILSTKAHGYVYPLYPLLARFNYVISSALLNNRLYYFDASVPRLGFGKLPSYCYNGQARMINPQVVPVDLNADSILEKKISSVFLINDEKGFTRGTMQQSLGLYESLQTRDEIKEHGKEDFMKGVRKTYGEDIKVTNPVIDSLDKPDVNLAISYDLSLKENTDDIIYFNPMFAEGYKQNPFKSAERFYPVEMPFATDEYYLLNMEIPKGYVVDELPKSIRVKLNEQGDGTFEYMIQQQDDRIALRSRIIIKKTFFQPEEYDLLREFYGMLVKKQSEQIVFKKKK